MRKIFWLGVLAAAFYGHSRFVFSEPALMSWTQKQTHKELHTADGFCDAYADKLVFHVTEQTAHGPMSLEGGKEELCEHIKDAAAVLRAARASVSVDSQLVAVQRSSFPWLSAQVQMRQTSTIRMRGAPPVNTVMNTSMEVRRTLSGRQIVAVGVDSETSIP